MRARKAKQSRKKLEEPIINLTPLIDVVFVVLIMFMIVAPLLELDNVELASSNASNSNSALKEKSSIAIHVRHDNTVWFKQRRVTTSQLTGLLKKLKTENPSIAPQLFHDKRAQFGTYQMVKGAVEAAGYKELDVILRPG